VTVVNGVTAKPFLRVCVALILRFVICAVNKPSCHVGGTNIFCACFKLKGLHLKGPFALSGVCHSNVLCEYLYVWNGWDGGMDSALRHCAIVQFPYALIGERVFRKSKKSWGPSEGPSVMVGEAEVLKRAHVPRLQHRGAALRHEAVDREPRPAPHPHPQGPGRTPGRRGPEHRDRQARAAILHRLHHVVGRKGDEPLRRRRRARRRPAHRRRRRRSGRRGREKARPGPSGISAQRISCQGRWFLHNRLLWR